MSLDPTSLRTLQYSTTSSISPSTPSTQWPQFSHYVTCPCPLLETRLPLPVFLTLG